MVAVSGKISVVMTDADHGEQNLEEKNREGEEADAVEDLLLDQEEIPPLSHLEQYLFMLLASVKDSEANRKLVSGTQTSPLHTGRDRSAYLLGCA